MSSLYETMSQDILASIERNAPRIGLRNPMVGMSPTDYQWRYHKDIFWTDSFWTGQLWLAYMVSGESKYRNLARMRYGHLERILATPIQMNHDLGFQFSLSAVADYKLTGNKESRALALRAAEALRNRFNWNGNYLVAWTAGSEGKEHAEQIQGKIIIDCMENLPLLMWAYSETNIESFKTVAIAQAETTIKHIIRDDWSSYHTFDFDTTTNEPIRGCNYQGYADESCWARGQAWAIHGFAQLALMSGEKRYADISAKLLDFVMEHISDDCIPIWDYRLPEHEVPYKDSSAGSVTSAGALLLSQVLEKFGDGERAQQYHQFGLKMLGALRDECDLTNIPEAQGLLNQAASFVHVAHDLDLDYLANSMLPYGDYYYYEAVLRAMGHTNFFW
ncbi:glycoside hydrolase family 88 protein [Vibrio mediterranei]|jgi:unsaturated chondroitin disaccharide hydrolase|uniref:glycoside hydrolase family 88 protein n=1 Tax=Vibrio mediterranei TaxID=689 RepID=UPI0017D8B722|nr:glycoside hydrolase family 88 protein [Vibrio mediterranei]NUW75758.1 glycoside hydrolase family 88 protein [Vibrio mediterranei]